MVGESQEGGAVVPDKIWTAEELAALSPAEQDALFDASIITDPADAPPELIARVRDRIEARIAAQDFRSAS
jgi:hypothetical protein